jgi:hypothetical protein
VLGAALVTGALGAVTLIVAQRFLGLEAFAPLAQLWTMWAVLAAGFTFSFQQWAAVHDVGRSTLLTGADGARVRLVLLAISVGLLVITTLGRDVIFHSDSMAWPIAAGVLPLGTALNGVRRGQLARHRQRAGLAAVIAGENVVRLIVTGVLVALDASAVWFTLALLAGFVVVLGPTPGRSADISEPGTGRGIGTLGAAAAAGFLAHAFMFGSPILLTLAGGSANAVSALFLVLAGVRMPFVVLQAVVPQLAVSLAAAPDPAVAIRRTRSRIVIIGLAAAVAAAAAGYVLGDAVIGTVFGIRGEVSAESFALLGAASVMSASALVATVLLVVEGRSRRIIFSWGVPALSAVVVTMSGLISDTNWLAVWLCSAQATVAVLALTPSRHLNAPDDPQVGTISPQHADHAAIKSRTSRRRSR